jgi:hypothetical protein
MWRWGLDWLGILLGLLRLSLLGVLLRLRGLDWLGILLRLLRRDWLGILLLGLDWLGRLDLLRLLQRLSRFRILNLG